MEYTHDDIKDYIETQLLQWPLAKRNYDGLSKVERRKIIINGYDFYLQFNPERIISTGASVDKEVIQRRKCFLCKENRPKEQSSMEIVEGWELLVNPYPIFPVHLTIASVNHVPQKFIPADIVEMALRLKDMVVFFNGAKAGASAPDHLHLQAVLKDELPLINLVEKIHPESAPRIFPSDALIPGFPFLFFTGVVEPDDTGLKVLMAGLNMGGSESGDSYEDKELVNAFFWIGKEGKLRFIVIPRKAHRPKCYYDNEENKKVVSPGCVDMAGLLILPRLQDYELLSEEDVLTIYSDVAFPTKKYEKKS